MRSQPISPPIWRALLKRTAAELRWLIALGVLFAFLLLMPTFNPELGATSDGDVAPGRLSMAQRLGYAVLLNSGVATLQPLTADQRDELRNALQLPWPIQISGALPRCIANDTVQVDGQDLSIRSLTLSIISAEIYNRDGLTQSAKFALSRAYQKIKGVVPNFSYGISEIKLSTAKSLLATTADNNLADKDIYQILENDCDNASLAGRYVASILADRAPKNLEDAITIAATAYVGANHASETSRLYVEAVSGAYHLLEPDQPPPADDKSSQNKVTFCIGFPRGAGTGTPNSELGDFVQANPAALQVAVSAQLWTAEEKPLDYRSDLMSARHKWLTDNLKTVGLDASKTTVTDIDTANGRDHALSDVEQCDLSFAKITLDMPAAPETPAADSDTSKTPPPEPASTPASAAPMAPAIKLPPTHASSGKTAGRPPPPPRKTAPLPRAPQD